MKISKEPTLRKPSLSIVNFPSASSNSPVLKIVHFSIVISVMPEHIHVEVQVSMNLSASKVLQILKGLSAKLFFMKNPKARLRYPKGHLWSRGKFASSVGFVQEEVVRNYILNQEEHHRGNSTL